VWFEPARDAQLVHDIALAVADSTHCSARRFIARSSGLAVHATAAPAVAVVLVRRSSSVDLHSLMRLEVVVRATVARNVSPRRRRVSSKVHATRGGVSSPAAIGDR
jgi:hypothetical protein